MKIVVIGAGAGGMAAATRAKRVNPAAEVTVLEASDEFSRGTCSLPYYLSGEIEEERFLWGASRQKLEAEGVQLRLNTRATKIHPGPRKVDTTGDTYHYDRLIVSTGSGARCSRAMGLNPSDPGVWQLRTFKDLQKIQRELASATVRRVAVIGGGYVGLELSEALRRRGLEVTLLHRSSALVRLDPTLNERLIALLNENGIDVRLNTQVERVDTAKGSLRYLGPEGPGHEQFDAFAICHGIEPKTELLTQAGARTGKSGAVKVSARGETGLANIYACGDGVEIPNPVGGSGRWIPLATTAARLGRVCGENAAGGSLRLGSNLGALTVRIFDLQLGLVGTPPDWCNTNTRSFGFEWGQAEHPFSKRRAGVGVLYTDKRTGKLRGMQALGPEASRLVDLASMCVEQELTMACLQNFDYAYNPPLSSLWHPFYLASRAAEKETPVGGYAQ
jgi:NADPH-dependent 2,4-dienoyl-CoA reductase/sulfur reductase-like enzyme